MYDLSEMSEALSDGVFFEDLLEDLLETLENSSGCILVDDLPPCPFEDLGLVVQKHATAYIISYNSHLFALLKQRDMWFQNVVGESFLRFLQKAEPNSKVDWLEINLLRSIML